MDYSYSGLLLSRSRRHDASISIHDSAELPLFMLAYKSVMDPFRDADDRTPPEVEFAMYLNNWTHL